jgi:hypothetical protein
MWVEGAERTLRGLRSARGLGRLDDPLFPVGIYEYYRSFFAREDLPQPRKIGADERGSIRISSRTFRDPVLDRSVEPL